MIRSFLKFLISRSLDDGATPPNWLQAAAQRDADVGKFSQEASQLDALLRSSAAAHRQAMAEQPAAPPLTLPPERQPQPTTRRSNHAMKVFVGLATAAAVLIAVSPTAPSPEDARRPRRRFFRATGRRARRSAPRADASNRIVPATAAATFAAGESLAARTRWPGKLGHDRRVARAPRVRRLASQLAKAEIAVPG